MDKWGFKKNITTQDMQFIVAKDMKRRQQGKDTKFLYREVDVSTERIDNFKRRKTGKLLANAGGFFCTHHFLLSKQRNKATPPHITYHTPRDNGESVSQEVRSYHSSWDIH
jgi:hypothetical protein